jgi:hypothetical protein
MPKYNSIFNIPAKLFFDILENKDFKLLEPLDTENEEEAEKIFISIYDDYFIKSENHKSKDFLELRQEVAFMTYKIESVIQVLNFLMFNKTTPEMREILLDSLISIGININKENLFLEEVQNILQIELGQIQNDINFSKMQLEGLTSDNQESVFNFYEHLISLETAHERNLDDEMVLAKYIEYERLAIKKAEIQKQKDTKFNT